MLRRRLAVGGGKERLVSGGKSARQWVLLLEGAAGISANYRPAMIAFLNLASPQLCGPPERKQETSLL